MAVTGLVFLVMMALGIASLFRSSNTTNPVEPSVKTASAPVEILVPILSAQVNISGYEEVRTERSGWGKFWKWSLLLWTLFFAWSAMSVVIKASELSKVAGALAQVMIDNRLVNVLITDFVIWAMGACVLGFAVYATRGQRRLIPIASK